MKLKHFVAALALSTSAAMSAQAAVISGWDFSQWISGGGLLSVDNATLQNTLTANYSNLDPTFNAGVQSAQYGTMYMNGQFGSSNITPTGNGDEAFLPFAGSLASNITGILPNPFDSLTVLIAEGGQQEANLARMQANAATSIVFSATPGANSDTWSVAFGARTDFAGASIIVEFSTDGSSYASLGTASLTGVDTLYSFAAAPGVTSQAGYFRLVFSGAGPQIDNLAISATVPEPAIAGLLALGLGGLGYLGRRRKA